MPHALSHDARIYWRSDGDPGLPALVLGNSLGTDFSLWDAVLPRLLQHFYVVRYDMRGHGASDAPAGEYSLDLLTDDLAAVIAAAGLTEVSYAGISLGGMVGMNYASRQPRELVRLVLSNTSAGFPDASVWPERIRTVLNDGMAALVDGAISRFFTPDFLATGKMAAQRLRNTFLGMNPQGYAGCCAAIRDMELGPARLAKINVPTLVISGELDTSTSPAMAQAIADAIADSRHVSLRSAHIPCVEIPLAYTDTLIDFLAPAPERTEDKHYEAGLARRKAILGEAHVERSLTTATPFNTPFQSLATRYAWGELWNSTRFDDAQRRLMVLALTAAQSRWEEFDLHVSAALRDGMEPEAIQETLLTVAIYCGIPAAHSGFKRANDLIREHRDND